MRGGGRDWRFFCGLISAFLANTPAIITALVLSDLSSIFCMFGFYQIMFYSGSLLCAFCPDTVSARIQMEKKNRKRNNTLGMAKWYFYSLSFSFDSFFFSSPLSEITMSHHKAMGPVWHWLRGLSRIQASIFINVSFCLLS